MAGTYLACSYLWLQLYKIHWIVEKRKFHVACCLLANNRETHARLCNLLKEEANERFGSELSTETIQADLESAVIGASEDIFPHADIRRCFSHY